jgi:hypothetical protein
MLRHHTMKLTTLVLSAAVLAGCSAMGGLLNGKRGIPADQSVQTGNQLAMPPDLSLATPGTGTAPQVAAADSIDEGDVLDGGAAPAPVKTRKDAALAAQNPQGDIYEQYGISRLKPDGTKKEDWELREELRKAIIARKRQQNPGYGTIRNIGGLFSDG